ncbi:DUF2271 domain-containing protein [Verrucomicrobiaceae bacterium 227]
MKKLLLLALTPLLARAEPADLSLTIQIPRLQVAEYHRPYVAVWIETPSRKPLKSLAVWYDTEMKDQKGEKWLKDLRQWWRKEGRSADLPLDGVSSPTKPVGTHDLEVTGVEIPAIAEGEYTLIVEASREVGGRELIKIPFAWDGKTAVSTTVSGKSELGTITFAAKAAQ